MKLFIGCPTLGSVSHLLTERLLQLCQEYQQYEYEFCFNSKQPTDNNRNQIVDKFLKSEADILLFIDDDMLPSNELFELIKCDKDIIAPLTVIHQEELKTNLFMFTNKKINYDSDLIKVDACGCGCVLIKREVFSKIEKPYFKFISNDDGKLLMSETFYFYKKLFEKKIDVFVHKNMSCGHLKKIDLRYINNVYEKGKEAGKKE